MNDKFRTILFYLMLIFIFGLGIYLVVWINSEGYKYMKNPFGYSMLQLEQKNNATAYCNGMISNDRGSEQFYINDTGLYFNPLDIKLNNSGGS